MKREVASSLVERGVAERVRLTQAYEKKKTELQKQHDTVKSQLNDHKDKVCVGLFFHFDPFGNTPISKSKSFEFHMCAFVCFLIYRLEHYLKKIVNLGHAFHPKDF